MKLHHMLPLANKGIQLFIFFQMSYITWKKRLKVFLPFFCILIFFSIIFGLLMAEALSRALSIRVLPPATHPFVPRLHITATDSNTSSLLLRKRFNLATAHMNGTIYINAHDSFTLYINGNKIQASPSFHVIREYNQSVSSKPKDENWHMAFQLDVSRGKDYVYIYDISSLLIKGKNVIAVKLKSPDTLSTLALEAIFMSEHGEKIKIVSDESWKVSKIPLMQWEKKWYTLQFDDSSWHYATTQNYSNAPPRCHIDEAMFTKPFTAPFITAPDFATGEYLFYHRIDVPTNTSDMWIRMVSSSYVHIFVNNKHVQKVPPSDTVINMYNLVQHILPGRTNEIAVRVIPEDPFRPASFAMDGSFSGGSNKHSFFSTGGDWKIINPFLKNWKGISPCKQQIQYAEISAFFPFYKNALYTKQYHGVIRAKNTFHTKFYLFITVPGMLVLFHLPGIFLIKKKTGQFPFSSILKLMCSHVPAGFTLIVLFTLESKTYLQTHWIFFKHPLFWQIAILTLSLSTLIIYMRTVYLILKSVD